MMLEAVIGQSGLKSHIETAIRASRFRDGVFGHFLLSGMGGLGKTHILNAVADELDYHVETTQGNRLTLKAVGERLKLACNNACEAGKPAFLIIDEIHEMSDDAQEELYYPMDERQILTKTSEPILLWPFCLAGATTVPEELDGKSLVNRFSHHWRLEALQPYEIVYLINSYFLTNNLRCGYGVMKDIAKRSQGNPRLALKYATKTRDYAQTEGRDLLKAIDLKNAFKELGIDVIGLDQMQQKYLLTLHGHGKPVGVESLAAMLQEVTVTHVKRIIEPFLLKQRLIHSTNKGRALTNLGEQHIENLTI